MRSHGGPAYCSQASHAPAGQPRSPHLTSVVLFGLTRVLVGAVLTGWLESGVTRVLVARAVEHAASVGPAGLAALLILLLARACRHPRPTPSAEPGDPARSARRVLRPVCRAQTGQHGLTARELEVLRLMATSSTYREIASQLVVGEETVRTHAKNILHKLEQPDRRKAVLAAAALGLL
jgi:ATP/maltotriose-dependent transcriptional regulator MalT